MASTKTSQAPSLVVYWFLEEKKQKLYLLWFWSLLVGKLQTITEKGDKLLVESTNQRKCCSNMKTSHESFVGGPFSSGIASILFFSSPCERCCTSKTGAANLSGPQHHIASRCSSAAAPLILILRSKLVIQTLVPQFPYQKRPSPFWVRRHF